MKAAEIEDFFGPENWLVTGAARHEMPRKGPQTCAIRPKKLVETSSNVPYCKAVRIRDGAPKFGRAPKISPEHVLAHKNGAKRLFSKKHVRRPHPVRSTGPSGVLLVGVSVHIQAT